MTGLLNRVERSAAARQVEASLAQVRELIDARLGSELPPVQELCARLEGYRGKMLRPTLTLLSGLAFAPPAGGEAPCNGAEAGLARDHIAIAAVVEIVHLATLVHDDVLDDADTRRRTASINRTCGNETAVILGDYLIAASYHLCSTIESRVPALRIGEVTARVCEGELLQLHHRGDYDLDERTYFEIIQRKTASLIGVACELGAWASGAAERTIEAARLFGERVGAAFQIRDDLLDLVGEELVVGKTLGRDLVKGKLTLPVIHHLATADPARREATLALLKQALEGMAPEPLRLGIGEALEATASIEHAQRLAESLIEEAKQAVADADAHPEPGRLLAEMADAVLDRQW